MLIAILAALPAIAQEKMLMTQKILGKDAFTLMATPLAEKAGLEKAVGFAKVDAKNGIVNFAVTLPECTSLPAGSVLEGWVGIYPARCR